MANWDKILHRGNVEDRRSMGPAAVGGIGLTGVLLLIAVNFLLGGDASDILNQLESIPIEQQNNIQIDDFAGEDTYEVFASTVVGSNNEMWSQMLSRNNKTYTEPTLVLFRNTTESACGYAASQMGPHYCPLDKTIYLDETFFDELKNRFGAKGGDVAEAYVIAHEVAHHAQNELGIMDEVMSVKASDSEQANALSIRLELQADCFAGLWAHSIRDLNVFLPGEINEAMDAAAAVGDDRIQGEVSGSINPETWTHGSSEQRVAWFNKGLHSGIPSECDTFNPQ